MGRLPGFDYKKPYYYLVTLKRKQGLAEFSRIRKIPADGAAGGDTLRSPERYIEENAITYVFTHIIRTFHEKWRCVAPITTFAIMPDHIHLLVRLLECEKPLSLSVIVFQLMRSLTAGYWGEVADDTATGNTPREAGIFEMEWHDWILKKRGGKLSQLAVFTRYIRENAYRHWLRRENRRLFSTVREVSFLGRTWYGYGNLDLLELPVLEAFKGHRSTEKGSAEWQAMVAAASRIGPDCAGVSTFMSPLEKEVGNAIFKAGGNMVVLHAEGFGDHWHPTRNQEQLCSEGRMLFLSLYPPSAAKPDKATMYQRCHEMVDLAVESLAGAIPRRIGGYASQGTPPSQALLHYLFCAG